MSNSFASQQQQQHNSFIEFIDKAIVLSRLNNSVYITGAGQHIHQIFNRLLEIVNFMVIYMLHHFQDLEQILQVLIIGT